MRLTSLKHQVKKSVDYDKRGLTRAELSFMESTSSGDYIAVQMELSKQAKEKRFKVVLHNLRTFEQVEVFADKAHRLLEPLGAQ